MSYAPQTEGRARVRLLPDTLVDQIAAGEVVERPASVVKELVENALDAGGRRLRIDVRGGGADLVAVTDDGSGMDPDDARLALQRHATSKLASQADLQRIASYGFRGEALPSIGSVSRMRLLTRTAAADAAFEIVIEAGQVKSARPAGGPIGTRIEVADLFAQVPARRKFLKSAVTEWGHIADWLGRAALARPDVHFDVQREDRPAFAWPAVRDPLDRIAAVLSDDEAAALVPIEHVTGSLRIRGFTSRPDWHRASAEGLHLFVNGRPVRDRLVRHATLEVYRDVLPRGRFPAAVLFLELPLDAVDVNVHPAKWEVRFADPRSVHRELVHALRAAIASRAWLSPAAVTATQPRFEAGFDPQPFTGEAPRAASASTTGASDWLFAERAAASAFDWNAGARDTAPARRPLFGEMRVLGQLLASYILIEAKDGLLLVDQHAAHERVLYERLRSGWLTGAVERQPLLVPFPLELDPAAHAAIVSRSEVVTALGFELDDFGERAVIVRAVPAILGARDPLPLVRSLADALRQGEATGIDVVPTPRIFDAIDRIFATLACHAARTQGEALATRELEALLRALDEVPWAATCPHGRPVALPLSLSEIERRFGRR